MPTNLSGALENSCPGPPNPFPADNISGDVHLSVHKASLLQGYVVIQVCFDGGAFLGHDLGFDGSDFLHWHSLWQGSDEKERKVWVIWTVSQMTWVIEHHHKHTECRSNPIIPNLVSLHDTLFVAFQTSGQTLFIQTHSLLILKKTTAQKALEIYPALMWPLTFVFEHYSWLTPVYGGKCSAAGGSLPRSLVFWLQKIPHQLLVWLKGAKSWIASVTKPIKRNVLKKQQFINLKPHFENNQGFFCNLVFVVESPLKVLYKSAQW